MKSKKIVCIALVLLFQTVLFTSCASNPPAPPKNVPPSPVFKSEGITFDGSEWYHVHFADKEGITQAFMKNKPIIITVKFGDGREGRIWTECDENSEVFIPNLSDEFKDCKISFEIDSERWHELCEIQKAKDEEQKSRVALGEKRGEILSPSPVRWTFSDEKVEITVKFGYPEADEMKIKLDYKKIKYKFYKWQGKYAATDSHIELFVTDYTEGYKDGVGGYGSLTDYCELSYSLDGDTLTIHMPLSDVLYSADKLEKGYRFPVPLVLTKEQAQ